MPTISRAPTSNVALIDRPIATERASDFDHSQHGRRIRRRQQRSLSVAVAGVLAAAPERNTERSRSVRPSNSAVGPLKRIVPRSMKYARSATVSATFTLCSTRITAVPSAATRCTSGKHLTNHHRGQPERQLVDQQHTRLGHERHAQREHLLLATAEVACRQRQPIAQHREHLQHFGDGCIARHRARAGRVQPGELQVLLHGQTTEHALPAGHLADAESGDLVRAARG